MTETGHRQPVVLHGKWKRPSARECDRLQVQLDYGRREVMYEPKSSAISLLYGNVVSG